MFSARSRLHSGNCFQGFFLFLTDVSFRWWYGYHVNVRHTDHVSQPHRFRLLSRLLQLKGTKRKWGCKADGMSALYKGNFTPLQARYFKTLIYNILRWSNQLYWRVWSLKRVGLLGFYLLPCLSTDSLPFVCILCSLEICTLHHPHPHPTTTPA